MWRSSFFGEGGFIRFGNRNHDSVREALQREMELVSAIRELIAEHSGFRWMRERLLLQIFVALGGIIPVATGAAGIFLGPDFVGATVGMAADSHFRYLSGLLLGLGLGFWSTIPRIEANGTRFRLLTFPVVIGGLGRLFSLAAIGLPSAGMLGALAMELGVTPLLCFWQWRISRKFNLTMTAPADRRIRPRQT
jgi:hypothetical protein